MTTNRFNRAKQASSGNLLHRSNISLSACNAQLLFLEDNNNIDIKDIYQITNVHSPIDEKDVVIKEYCDNKLLSSDNNIDI